MAPFNPLARHGTLNAPALEVVSQTGKVVHFLLSATKASNRKTKNKKQKKKNKYLSCSINCVYDELLIMIVEVVEYMYFTD